ncbi:helix-turn-helix domain-containing protein [Pseudomonas sp. hsmgli-8]|uniref:Helix-turn-helix domain-containing protein n=1 Tax=Pseudomonas quercus TaxID=2722792 RepID=A0ABX0YJH5_9PSED|nr:XRE family transcriptional regulator [Pseudomonas quercus]NJP03477.1 helix-turn-helix domain-containing protein [Pseudomonas quercus]
MDIGQIIRNARKAKRLSLEELAHRIGSDSGNLSRFERGLQGTTPEKLKLIMAALDIQLTAQQQMETVLYSDPNNVSGARQPIREPREFPLISWVEAGEVTESPGKIGENHRMIQSTENAGYGGYWLTVNGHSMTCTGNPSFPEGSLILVKPDADVINGKYYVVEMLDSGDKTFKQYVEDAGYRYLRPLNEKYRTIEIDGNCRFLGRVVDARMSGL